MIPEGDDCLSFNKSAQKYFFMINQGMKSRRMADSRRRNRQKRRRVFLFSISAYFCNTPPAPSGSKICVMDPKIPAPRPFWLGNWFVLLWFVIAAFILFGRTLHYDYTYLDDQTLVFNSMDKLKSPAFLPKAFTEDAFHLPRGQGFYYRPMLTLTFMADAMAGKGAFSFFHFSNILYHILAVMLLFLLFTTLGFDRIRSFLFSMVFLVHPLVSQAVAWVPGRNDSLLAIFVLGTFLFWVRFLKSGKATDLFLHLLFFAGGLFTKENAIALPLILLLYTVLIPHASLKKLAIPASLWILFVLCWWVLRARILQNSELSLALQMRSVLDNFPAVLPFFGKFFFPFNLSVFPILADMRIPMGFGIVTLIILGLLTGLSKPWYQGWFLFGLCWFMIFLLPSFITVNSVVPNFSEHRGYLPVMGLLMILLATGPIARIDFSKPKMALGMAGIILLFGVLTFLHISNFRDSLTFWTNAVESSPSHAFNYNNLGAMYFMGGDNEKAEKYFRKALDLNPSEPKANANVGLVLMNTGRFAEAEKYYKQEIAINPVYDNVYFNLGLLYYNHLDPEKGIQQWEKTLEVNPSYTDAYKALLFGYEKMGRRDDYQRVLAKAKENGVKL